MSTPRDACRQATAEFLRPRLTHLLPQITTIIARSDMTTIRLWSWLCAGGHVSRGSRLPEPAPGLRTLRAWLLDQHHLFYLDASDCWRLRQVAAGPGISH